MSTRISVSVIIAEFEVDDRSFDHALPALIRLNTSSNKKYVGLLMFINGINTKASFDF